MKTTKQLLVGLTSLFAVLFVLSVFVACGGDASDSAKESAPETTAAADQKKPAATPAKAEEVVPAGPLTNMSFTETEFDFGSVDEGEKVSHVYKFTNTGKEPLILSNAKGSCGCTVPQWPREPIAPGEEGEIKVEFNSKGKKGKRNQKVTITANTEPAQTFIYLKGEVIPGEGGDNSGVQIQPVNK